MAWYRTGTASVTAASTTVTGSGTAFVANARVGDAFIGPDGRLYEISNVASDSAISILPAYIGSSASGQGYAISPVQGYVKKLADEAGQLLNEYGNIVDTLGTAATRNVTTSPTDTTAGRLLQVGDGGLLKTASGNTETVDANLINSTRFIQLSGASTNLPAGGDGALLLHIQWAGSDSAYQSFHRISATYERFKWGGIWTSWSLLYSTRNTTVDSNGFLKSASPIVRLYSDKIIKNGDFEAIFERRSTGFYILSGTKGLAKQGWFIEVPKDTNGNIKVFVEYETLPENKVVIKTFEPNYSYGKASAGSPMEIPVGRWIDLRLEEPESDDA